MLAKPTLENRGMPTLERYPLFQMIWTMPATKVAAQHGISSNALGKICKAMHIPVPPRGYWAKLHSGHEPAMGSLSVPNGDTVLTWEIDVIGSAAQRAAVEERAARTRHSMPLPKLPPLKTELTDLHPLVVSTREEFRESFGGKSVMVRKKQRWLDLRVSFPLLARGLLFLENLVRAAESQGIGFGCYADRRSYEAHTPYYYRCWLSMNGFSVPFHVKELPATAENPNTLLLQLQLYGSGANAEFRWGDSTSGPLESKISEIIQCVKDEMVKAKDRAALAGERRRSEEEARAQREALERERERQRQLNQHRKETKDAAKTSLLVAVRESGQALHLKRFISKVQKRNQGPLPPEAELWFQWAEGIIAELQEDEVEPWKMRSFEKFLPQICGHNHPMLPGDQALDD